MLEDAFDSPAHAAVARTALSRGRPDATVQAAAPLGRGNRKSTARVDFTDGGSVVVQVADGSSRLLTEAAVLETLADRTAVPVPAVVTAGADGDVGYLVTERVAGRDLHQTFVSLDATAQREITRGFGRSLAAVHEAVRFDAFGPVTDRDGSLVASGPGEWGDWFRGYGRRAVDRLPDAFDDVRNDLAAVVATAPVADDPLGCLYPWDLRPGNALVRNGDLAAILDWESPLAAAPALSVAKAEYLVVDWYVADPDRLRSAFVAGYESVREWPQVNPAHRVAAIADSAVDSRGVVTNPRYPELDHDEAVAFHRDRLAAAL